jgi:RND superfamily putative drug exporter
MSEGPLARLSDRLFVHHRRVILVWALLLLAMGIAMEVTAPQFQNSFTVPGTNSQQALDVLDKDFPSETAPTAFVVFYAPDGGITGAEQANAIAASVENIGHLPEVEQAQPPLDPKDVREAFEREVIRLVPPTVSRTGKLGLGRVSYSVTFRDLADGTLDDLEAAVRPAHRAGLEVVFGGPVIDYLEADSGISRYAEELGLVVAGLLLILLFRSVLSAAMPLVNAIAGLGAGILALRLLANVFTIGSTAPDLAAMIGLGVGIDYGLFLTARYRQELVHTRDRRLAAQRAMSSTGSAVLFSGTVVCIATAGLALAGIPYVTMLGLCASAAVAIMVVTSMTLLPSLWALAGERITPRDLESGQNLFRRLARHVCGHPWRYLVGGTAVLLLLAVPLLSIRFGFPDDAAAPRGSQAQRSYDLIAGNLGPGANGPLIVVIDIPTAADRDARRLVTEGDDLLKALRATPGVAKASAPIPDAELDAAIALVQPTTGPNARATAELVDRLRDETLPRVFAGTRLEGRAYVGGETASLIDLTGAIGDRLPYAIAAVCLAAYLLLLVIFRSLLLPLKAVVMNLLSIGAAYGIVVAAFQWGWFTDVLGLGARLDVVAFVPLLMFALMFGLSMDYELLLLTRIRDEYRDSGETTEAVANGLARSGRVITSAAVVMIAVFLIFALNPNPAIKMLGVGMAAAVLVDATVVRMLLVPATMTLMGKGNWWLPRWLDRALPHIDLEGTDATA